MDKIAYRNACFFLIDNSVALRNMSDYWSKMVSIEPKTLRLVSEHQIPMFTEKLWNESQKTVV